MICVCESEVLLYHLYLYTRRVYPGIPFHESSLRMTLAEENITHMQQLFHMDVPDRARLAERVLSYLPPALLPEIDPGRVA